MAMSPLKSSPTVPSINNWQRGKRGKHNICLDEHILHPPGNVCVSSSYTEGYVKAAG